MTTWKLFVALSVTAAFTLQSARADEGKKPSAEGAKPGVKDGEKPGANPSIKNGRIGGVVAKVEGNNLTVEVRGEGNKVRSSTVYPVNSETVIMIDGKGATVADLKPEMRINLQLSEDLKTIKAAKVFTGQPSKDGGVKKPGEGDKPGVKKPGGDGVKKPGGDGVKKPGGDGVKKPGGDGVKKPAEGEGVKKPAEGDGVKKPNAEK